MFTLIAIEQPPYIRLPDNHSPQLQLADQHVEGQLAADGVNGDIVFITASIRSTLRHLRQQAGFFSPWRGFGLYWLLFIARIALWWISSSIIMGMMMPTGKPIWLGFIVNGLLLIAAYVMTSSVALAWT